MRKGFSNYLNYRRTELAKIDKNVWDRWIALHSPISPKKLHALGYVTYTWNGCEHNLFTLFCVVQGIQEKEGWVLAYDLGDIALMTRINVVAAARYKKWPDILELIKNCLEVYEVCRQNRNQLTHFTTGGYLSEEPRLFRKSKQPGSMEPSPFPDSIAELRRVGRDIRRLGQLLVESWTYLIASKETQSWPLPRKMRVPEPLWKPPAQVPTKRKRPPRSSRT